MAERAHCPCWTQQAIPGKARELSINHSSSPYEGKTWFILCARGACNITIVFTKDSSSDIFTICLHLGPCLNFTFWNNAHVPFILYSSLKPEGYLVRGPKLHLHYVICEGQVLGLKRIDHDYDRQRRGNDVEVLSEVSSKV